MSAALAVLALVAACSDGGEPDRAGPPPPSTGGGEPGGSRADLGGDATVEVDGSQAFAQSVPGLDAEGRRFFATGNNFFNDNWVTAPASTTGRDGLGPIFNAQSCSTCHFRDGRAQPPTSPEDPERGLLLRLSVATPDGSFAPHPELGSQLQDRAIRGVPPEGQIVIETTPVEGRFDDGTRYELAAPSYRVVDPDGRPIPDLVVSPRVAPAMFGLGLLEGVSDRDIEANADPDDADGDGISGRAAVLTDPATGEEALGRFGWKALAPTIRDQSAAAFQADIGITSPLQPDQPCTPSQTACSDAPNGGDPEVDDQKLDRITFYTRTLAVPARRDVGATDTDRGEALFTSIGCASCHLTEMRSGPSDVAALDDQVFHPYTDLLLHDMGPGLADGRPEGAATGTEWRTPPLWGLGLIETVNGHVRLLHDGRADGIEEAILWHGGEADATQRRYTELSAADRRALLAFLESL